MNPAILLLALFLALPVVAQSPSLHDGPAVQPAVAGSLSTGAGSGLNADLLDSLDSTAFCRLSGAAACTMTGSIIVDTAAAGTGALTEISFDVTSSAAGQNFRFGSGCNASGDHCFDVGSNDTATAETLLRLGTDLDGTPVIVFTADGAGNFAAGRPSGTPQNVWTSLVGNTGSVEIAWDIRAPAGYTSSDHIATFGVTTTPLFLIGGTGAINAKSSGHLSGTTTANVWGSNVTNTGGVDTGWRFNTSFSDANDVAFTINGLFAMYHNGDLATGGTASNVLTSNFTATGGTDTFWKLVSTGESGSDLTLNIDDKFYFTSSSLGIGATPGELFDITGSGAGFRGGISRNSTTTGSAGWTVAAATNSNGNFNVYGSGSVGISFFGTVNDGFMALVSSGAGSTGLKLGSLTSDPVIFGTNDLTRLTITSGGDFQGTQVTSGTPLTWRLPTAIANDTITLPTCSTSANAGQKIYVDDSNDAASGMECICRADSGGTYAWVASHDNATACIDP